jgi:Flp pilus assembly protein CpaB
VSSSWLILIVAVGLAIIAGYVALRVLGRPAGHQTDARPPDADDGRR